MSNQVMCLSAYGCSEVNRTALSSVELPEVGYRTLKDGSKAVSYQPIGHDYLVDMVEDCMADIGFRFGPQHHGLSHDGARYFGVVELMWAEQRDDFALVLGLRNSLDKRFPAGVAFGKTVRVCANLDFSGEQSFGRKHTANILRDLPNMIMAAVSNTKTMAHNQVLRAETYQGFKLRDELADHLIMNMLRRGAINATRVPKVVQEWDEPSYDHGPRTMWRLFNAATEALKGTNIHEMPKRTIELQAICDEATEFLPVAAAA